MSNLKMYITFKYNDDKKIYLDKASMIVEIIDNSAANTNASKTTSKQVNGNVVPNKILYEDVTMDMISKLLSLDL